MPPSGNAAVHRGNQSPCCPPAPSGYCFACLQDIPDDLVAVVSGIGICRCNVYSDHYNSVHGGAYQAHRSFEPDCWWCSGNYGDLSVRHFLESDCRGDSYVYSVTNNLCFKFFPGEKAGNFGVECNLEGGRVLQGDAPEYPLPCRGKTVTVSNICVCSTSGGCGGVGGTVTIEIPA